MERELLCISKEALYLLLALNGIAAAYGSSKGRAFSAIILYIRWGDHHYDHHLHKLWMPLDPAVIDTLLFDVAHGVCTLYKLIWYLFVQCQSFCKEFILIWDIATPSSR